jgi:hypothetical protein
MGDYIVGPWVSKLARWVDIISSALDWKHVQVGLLVCGLLVQFDPRLEVLIELVVLHVLYLVENLLRTDLVEDWTLGQINAPVPVFTGDLYPPPGGVDRAHSFLVDTDLHVLRPLGLLTSCDATHGTGCERYIVKFRCSIYARTRHVLCGKCSVGPEKVCFRERVVLWMIFDNVFCGTFSSFLLQTRHVHSTRQPNPVCFFVWKIQSRTRKDLFPREEPCLG